MLDRTSPSYRETEERSATGLEPKELTNYVTRLAQGLQGGLTELVDLKKMAILALSPTFGDFLLQ